MNINIVIPVNNRKENILKVLKCIDRQEVKPGHTFRTIIVNDNSTDGTKEAILKTHYDNKVTVVDTPKRDTWNAAIPRNFGAKQTDGDLIYFIDSDVLLPSGRIQRLIDVYAEDPDPNRVIIGSYHFCNKTIDVSDPNWYLQEITDYVADIRWASFNEHDFKEKGSGVGFALACFGGNIAIPRKLFFKTGGYDETFEAGVEDGEFGLTLWETGAVFSLDKGLHGWHIPHPILPSRTRNIPEMVKKLDEKHNMSIVKETGRVYRQWGLDWTPPEVWLENSGYTLEDFKNEMKGVMYDA